MKLQASTLQYYEQWNLPACTFQAFCLLLGRTYFKERPVIVFSSNYSHCVHAFVLCAIDFIETEFL